MPSNDPVARLHRLAGEGHLKFAYVIGVARSNSTVVCRLLGDKLDGSVYEPATPIAQHRDVHFARTVLKAYDKARPTAPADRPVVLAIKDLSLFIEPATFAFIAEHADQVVFTIRDPLYQHPSLVKQFAHEFSPFTRVDAFFRHPVELVWMSYYFWALGAGFLKEASEEFGFSLGKWHQLAIAGWNLRSWRAIKTQFEALSRRGKPITILDAGQMRHRVEEATARIEQVAAAFGIAPNPEPVQVAGHSRMLPRSRWAAEALSSNAIKPGHEAKRVPKSELEGQFIAAFYPAYHALLGSEANPLLEPGDIGERPQRLPAPERGDKLSPGLDSLDIAS